MADMEDLKDRAYDKKDYIRETIYENRRGLGMGIGLGTAAALFTTGFIIGHKRAESQTMYHKILRRISDIK